MTRRPTAAIAFAAASIALHGAAHAVLISAGTAESVTIRDCISYQTPCDGLSAPLVQNYGGFPGAFSSSASATIASHGSATGSVALSGTVGAPILHASAFSNVGARTNTNSVALQRYTYEGDAPTTRTFGGALTYAQSINGVFSNVGVGSGVNAVIGVFTLGVDEIEAGDDAVSNFLTLFNVSALPGYTSLGLEQFVDTESNLAGSALLDVTVTLNPGDTVWVWARLQTPAPNGSWVDASHTLVTAWDDPTSLVPAAVAVPEPASFGLMALACGGLLLARRRRPR
jgi:hypothetical protein